MKVMIDLQELGWRKVRTQRLPSRVGYPGRPREVHYWRHAKLHWEWPSADARCLENDRARGDEQAVRLLGPLS